MSGALHGVLASLKSAAAAATDSFFKYVSLLLNTTSTNGAQNNTFIDSSTNNFSITRNGNPTQGTLSPFSQTGWSNYFDGFTDSLVLPASTNLDMGSGDFTWEMWVFLTISQANAFFLGQQAQDTTWQIGSSTNELIFYDGTNRVIGTLAVGTWTHVAVVRSGTTLQGYIGGTASGSSWTNSSATRFTMSSGVIGSRWGGVNTLNGYISNLRIVKGTAVYTANFTPPTAPLTAITNTSLLTCQSNRFIDNSSNAFAITRNSDVSVQAFSPFNPTAAWSASTNGGSGYFDGTGDYLTAPSNAAFDFGSGSFTIEGFIWTQSVTGSGIVTRRNSTNAGTYQVWFNGTSLDFYGDNNTLVSSNSTAVNNRQWHHFAVVRNGNNTTLYVNGIAGTTDTTLYTYPAGDQVLYIANDPENLSARDFEGYIASVRIVKGTAVYTANFTPPTAPLTAITNTSLLLNFTNAGIFDSASGNDLETVGNAQVSTVQSKWGTTSMAFDGTGDWLLNIDKPALRLGTAAFTIEMWVYRSASGTYGLVSKGTSTTGWSVSLNSSNQVVFSFAASSFNSTGTVAATTWTHIAVVREGTGTNQTKIYISGTNDGTGTVSTDFNQTNAMYVGADRVAGGAFNGYIDDLRITNGYARYTANFTAPTAAFPLN